MRHFFHASFFLILSILFISCSPEFAPENVPTDTVPPEDKMDSVLLELLKSSTDNKKDSTRELIKKNDLVSSDAGIFITITADKDEDLPALSAFIQEGGGKVTSSFENTIFAAVPVEFLRELAPLKAVWYIAVSQKIIPMEKK